MAIDRERYLSICKDAFDDLARFEDTFRGKWTARDLLGDSAGEIDVTLALKDFAQIACGFSVRLYPWSVLDSVFFGGFVSWLFASSPETDRFRVIVDYPLFLSSTPSDRREFRLARIILHEIAHVKYHLDNNSLGIAPMTEPLEEEEAWVYCGAVTGLILGGEAFITRSSTGVDQVWLRL